MKINLNALSNFDYFGVLLLRLGIGAIAVFHGFPILIGGMDAWREVGSGAAILTLDPFFFPAAGFTAAIIQAFGGFSIAIGLFTRASALFLTIVAGIAFANVIKGGDFGLSFFAHLQIVLTFLSVVFIGPGRISLDRKGI